MKKSVGLFVIVLIGLFSVGFVSAIDCDLSASLVNQDPYPAVPGDYVKVVFQLSGISNPNCGDVSFELIEEFPFSLDPQASPRVDVISGTYTSDYQSYLLIPYKLRVDEAAIDGDNPIDVVFRSEEGNAVQTKEFDINVEGTVVDFEVSIKDFDDSTNILTFEILNVGKNDIEALTVDLSKQDNVVVKGPNRNIVGNLDSHDDTTFKFEALPSDGEIHLFIYYNDAVSLRHMVEKTVEYDSAYFTDRKEDEVQAKSVWYYLFIAVVVIWILLWIRKRWKKKKMKERERKDVKCRKDKK